MSYGFWMMGAMGQGGSTPWTPAAIATRCWLDASDAGTITIDGSDGVSQINDKSGNGRHCTQSSATSRPLLVTAHRNGLDGMSFDGVNDQLDFGSGAFPQASGDTVFCVASTASIGTGWRIFLERSAASTSNLALYFSVGSGVRLPGCYWNNAARAVWNTSVQRAALFQWSITTSGGAATAQTRIDAGTPVDASFSASAMTNWSSVCNGAAQQAQVYIYEIVVATSPDVATRQKIEGYLMWKWGLESLLPSGHPYKIAPPTV